MVSGPCGLNESVCRKRPSLIHYSERSSEYGSVAPLNRATDHYGTGSEDSFGRYSYQRGKDSFKYHADESNSQQELVDQQQNGFHVKINSQMNHIRVQRDNQFKTRSNSF